MAQDIAANTQSYYNPVIDPKDQSILNFFAPRLGFTKRSDWNKLTDVICEPDACSKDPQIVCYRGKKDPGAVAGKKSCQQQQRERLYKFIGPKVGKLSNNGLSVNNSPAATPVTSQPTTPSTSQPATPTAASTTRLRPSTPNSEQDTLAPGGMTSTSSPSSTNGSISSLNTNDSEPNFNGAAVAGAVIGAGALTVLATQNDDTSSNVVNPTSGNDSLGAPLPSSGNNESQTLVPSVVSNTSNMPQNPTNASNTSNTSNIPQNTTNRVVLPEPKKPSTAVCSVKGASALRQNIEKSFTDNPITANEANIRKNEWNAFKVSLVAILSHSNIKVKKAKFKALYNSNEIYRDAMKNAYPQTVMNNIRTFTSCYLTLNDPAAFNTYIQAFLQAPQKKN